MGKKVGRREVNRRALVPDDEIVLRPVVAQMEARLRCMAEEIVEQRIALGGLEPDESHRVRRIDEERPPPRLGMGDHDRMFDGREGRFEACDR